MKLIRGGWDFKNRDKNGKPTRGPRRRLIGRLVYVSADLVWTGPGHGPIGGSALGMDHDGMYLVQKGEPARRVLTENGVVYLSESNYKQLMQEQQADERDSRSA